MELSEFNWHFTAVAKHGAEIIDELKKTQAENLKLKKELDSYKKALGLLPNVVAVTELVKRDMLNIPEFDWRDRAGISGDYKKYVEELLERTKVVLKEYEKQITLMEITLEQLSEEGK